MTLGLAVGLSRLDVDASGLPFRVGRGLVPSLKLGRSFGQNRGDHSCRSRSATRWKTHETDQRGSTLDLFTHRARCQCCWAPLDEREFVLCPDCGASYHPSCREDAGSCAWACASNRTDWSGDQLAREVLLDSTSRKRLLASLDRERESLLAGYRAEKRLLTGAFAAFAILTALVGLAIAVLDYAPLGVPLAGVVVAGLAVGLGVLYADQAGKRALNSLALVEVRQRNLSGPGASMSADC